MATANPFAQLLDIDRRVRGRRLPVQETAVQAGFTSALALRIGSQNLLFPLDEAAEIIPVPRITAVPGVKSWLLGITNLRGTVISLVDLKAFLSARVTEPGSRSRVVVVRMGDWGYGLLVDEIIGMRHFSTANQVTAPQELPASLHPYVARVFQSEGQQWFLFSTRRLVQDPRFLRAGN